MGIRQIDDSMIKKSRSNHLSYLFLIFIFSFFILIPLFYRDYLAGHDTKYHLANVLMIEDQILDGEIPTSPILDKIGYGLGYGSRLFYPPLSHTTTAYLSALLSFFDFTVIDAFRLIYFFTLFLSGITMYFLSYKFSKSRRIAFFSAIIYMTFPYHISDIYVRDSLAECFLFLFLPMILSGIYELFEGNTFKFYPLFIIGYVGGILSHFTLMIYFTFLLIPFLFISRKQVLKKEFLWPFVIACGSIVLIVSTFLVGIMENRILGDYVVFEPGEMTKRISKTALYPFEYLNVIPCLQSRLKFYFPVVVLLLLGITWWRRKKITFPSYRMNFLMFGFVAFFCSTKLFPWKTLPSMFQMIQFPWRLEIFVGLIVSLFAPLCLRNLSFRKCGVVAFVILFSAYFAIAKPSEERINLNDIWWNGGMGWQKEYLPVSAKANKDYIKKKKQSISFFSGSGNYRILENDMPKFVFHVNLNCSSVLELPRIYYPGYQLVGEDGEKIPLEMSEFGLLQTELLESGTYTLNYTGTYLVRITRFVSISAFILSIGCYCYFYRKKILGSFLS